LAPGDAFHLADDGARQRRDALRDDVLEGLAGEGCSDFARHLKRVCAREAARIPVLK
jgi:hypothetical protein